MTVKNKQAILPWSEVLAACENCQEPWMVPTVRILNRLQALGLKPEDLCQEGQLPMPMYETIIKLFDEELVFPKDTEYYLEFTLRFNIFQTIVGLLAQQIAKAKEKDRLPLVELTVGIVLRSIRQPPYTLRVWQQLATEYVKPEYSPVFGEIVDKAENMLLAMSGNSVYSFFSDKCTKEQIDAMLSEVHDAIKIEDEQRRYTIKHDHGHSKLLLTHVVGWMEEGKLKKQRHIYPLVRSLSAYWHHEFKLGTSQGTEKIFKRLCNVYY